MRVSNRAVVIITVLIIVSIILLGVLIVKTFSSVRVQDKNYYIDNNIDLQIENAAGNGPGLTLNEQNTNNVSDENTNILLDKNINSVNN